jgi:hypothetical protein
MQPAIELWDLDVLDASEPVMVLGGEDAEATAAAASKRPGAKPSKKASRAPVLRPGSHTDAVLGVAWNGARVGVAGAVRMRVLTLVAPLQRSSGTCWHPRLLTAPSRCAHWCSAAHRGAR